MAAVEVSGLVVRYGDRVAVDGLSLTAEPGEVVALLGPNGAGKTSTVETLEGYRRPDAGTVRVLGLDPVGEHDTLVPHIGVMLQRGGVYPSMPPAEAVHLFAAYYSDPDDPDALVVRLGLADVARTPWRRLSGGEQQRLSLALALVGRPRGRVPRRAHGRRRSARPPGHPRRDPRARATAVSCVLLTTHELEEAERVADRVVIIDRGKAVAAGTLADLLAGTGSSELAVRGRARSGRGRARRTRSAAHRCTRSRPASTSCRPHPIPPPSPRLTAWLAERHIPLGDLRAGRQSLEDLFLRLTGDATP